MLAVVNVVLNSSLSLQDQDELLSKQYHTQCLNLTWPSRNLDRRPKEINNTLSLEIHIKVEAPAEESKSEINTTESADVIQFPESKPTGQNIVISAVESSQEGESRNTSVATESNSIGDHVNIIEFIL